RSLARDRALRPVRNGRPDAASGILVGYGHGVLPDLLIRIVVHHQVNFVRWLADTLRSERGALEGVYAECRRWRAGKIMRLEEGERISDEAEDEKQNYAHQNHDEAAAQNAREATLNAHKRPASPEELDDCYNTGDQANNRRNNAKIECHDSPPDMPQSHSGMRNSRDKHQRHGITD